MTFQRGKTNPKTEAMQAAKAKVIALVSEGWAPHKAMAEVGEQPDTIRIWMMRDKKFAADLTQAKEDAKERSLTALGIAREDISFPQFSEMFLEQKVFPHLS